MCICICTLTYICFFKGGEERERNTDWLPFPGPPNWDPPETQACALTGNPTGNPLVRRLVLNPLSRTSQG